MENFEDIKRQIMDDEYELFGWEKETSNAAFYDIYKLYNMKYCKQMIKQYIMVFNYVTGNDPNRVRLCELLEQYSNIKTGPSYAYDDEAWVFAEIIREIDKYYEISKKNRLDIKNRMEREYEDIRKGRANPDTYKTRLMFEIAQNRYEIACVLLISFNDYSYGYLPKEECPNQGPEDATSSFNRIDMPIFVHEPCADDVGKELFESSPFFLGLRNIATLDSSIIKKMMRDENNGRVTIKLWEKDGEGYKPRYISTDKVGVYMSFVGDYNTESLWPGCIRAAFNEIGMDTDLDDPKKMLDMIIGPNKEKLEGTDLLQGPIPEEKVNLDTERKRQYYFNTGLSIYKKLLSIQQEKVRCTSEIILLCFALKEFQGGVIGKTGRPLVTLRYAMQFLKEKSDDVWRAMEEKNLSEPLIFEACSTVDKMYEQYCMDTSGEELDFI